MSEWTRLDGLRRRAALVWHLLDRVGWLIALAFLLVEFLSLHHQGVVEKHQSVRQSTFRVGQLRACHRLNVERARNNRNALSQYGSDKAILHYDLTFRTLVIASLHQQTSSAPRTKQQEAATRLFLSKLTTEIDAERASIRGLEWVPLTQCFPAVDHPDTYVAPEPVRVIMQRPPPGALQIGAGE